MKLLIVLVAVSLQLCVCLQQTPAAIANAKLLLLLRDGLRGGGHIKHCSIKRSPTLASLPDYVVKGVSEFPVTAPVSKTLFVEPNDSQDASSSDEAGGFIEPSNITDNTVMWYAAGVVMGACVKGLF
jgi:hypothetical protein